MDFKESFKKLQEKLGNQEHYTQFLIEPLEFIQANRLSFAQGNIIKYVCRYLSKNGIEDLIKARVYLDKLIEEAAKAEHEGSFKPAAVVPEEQEWEGLTASIPRTGKYCGSLDR